MADLASPKGIIDYYVSNRGPAIPRGSGLRPIGPTPPSVNPLVPYEAPQPFRASGIRPVATAEPINIFPSGEPIAMGGSAPPPALRPSGDVVGVAERGFRMSPSSTIDVTAKPVKPTLQLPYNPAPEPIRSLPNARGLKATTVFGKGASIGDAVVPAVKNAAKIGLRRILGGAAGGLAADMVLPSKANEFDDMAAIRNYSTGPSAEAQRLNGLSRMSDGTFPGQARFAASQGVSAPTKGIRRKTGAGRLLTTLASGAAALNAPLPASLQATPDEAPAPVEAAPVEAPVTGGTADQGYIEQGGIKMYVPGSKAYDQPGVSTLAGPAFDEPVEGFRPSKLAPGDIGYTGSTSEFEDQQATNNMFKNPFPFRTAKARLEQQTLQETAANNRGNLGIRQQEANTMQDLQGTQAMIARSMLPGNLQKQTSELLNDMVQRGFITEQTRGAYLKNNEVPADAASEREYKAAAGYGIRKNADTNAAELPYKQLLLGSEAGKNQSIIDNNPTKLEIAQGKIADAALARQEKAEAPIREAALVAAPIAGVPIDQAVAAIKAGYTAKKKSMRRKAGFYDAAGNRVDTSKLAGAAPVAVATATDSSGQKWVKYSDGTTAKAQ